MKPRPGAAPANLLPRFILGAQPLTPGWGRSVIRPHPGPLNSASGKIPTPRGPIRIDWKVEDDFKLVLTIPEGMTAKVEVPARASSRGVFLRGEPVIAKRIGTRWVLKDDISGSVVIEVR